MIIIGIIVTVFFFNYPRTSICKRVQQDKEFTRMSVWKYILKDKRICGMVCERGTCKDRNKWTFAEATPLMGVPGENRHQKCRQIVLVLSRTFLKTRAVKDCTTFRGRQCTLLYSEKFLNKIALEMIQPHQRWLFMFNLEQAESSNANYQN